MSTGLQAVLAALALAFVLGWGARLLRALGCSQEEAEAGDYWRKDAEDGGGPTP